MYSNSIDTSYIRYDNPTIYLNIRGLLSEEGKKQFTPYQRYLMIGDFICYITDSVLLENTLEIFLGTGLLPNYVDVTKLLNDKYLSRPEYSAKDCIKIRAIVYGQLLNYGVLTKYYSEFFEIGGPTFYFDVNDRIVSDNSDEVSDFIRSNSSKFLINYVKSLPDREAQQNEISKIIFSMAEISLKNKTNEFSFDIGKWKDMKDNLPDMVTEKPPYPFLKRGAYECCLVFLEKYIVEIHPDCSYLYSRMTSLGMIRKIGHIPFIDWLWQNNLIREREYNILLDKGQLLSLGKSDYSQRRNNFNIVFSELI